MLQAIRRPLFGAASWGGVGCTFALTVPGVMENFGLIYSSGVVGTAAMVGAVCVLAPLGAARSAIAVTHELAVDSGAVASAAREVYSTAVANTGSTTTLQDALREAADRGSLLGGIAAGGGMQGTMGRMMLSPFLPSTAMMLERVEAALNEPRTEDMPSTGDQEIVAAAASGLVEGFIQDKKDTATMVGIGLFAGIVGVGIAVDYGTSTAVRKIKTIKTIKDKS